MIIKTNNNVFKNYFGNENVSKVYAGENLVFGKEDPHKKATTIFQYVDIDGDKLQNGIGTGSVTIQNNQTIENYGTMTMDFMEGSEAVISFNGINNISNVEVKMWRVNDADIHSPHYGTTVSTGQLTVTQEGEDGKALLWEFNGNTGTIYFNNSNRDPFNKKYYTSIFMFEITVYYTD